MSALKYRTNFFVRNPGVHQLWVDRVKDSPDYTKRMHGEDGISVWKYSGTQIEIYSAESLLNKRWMLSQKTLLRKNEVLLNQLLSLKNREV